MVNDSTQADNGRANQLHELVRQNRYAAKTTAVVNGPDKVDQKQRTYVIVGNGRGGTSMVAGVAHLLGLELNHKNFGGGGFEDGDFVLVAQGTSSRGPRQPLNLSRRQITEKLRETVKSRNSEYDVWGWKDPEAFKYLSSISDLLPDPHLIVVWRDPAAIATAIMEANDLSAEKAFRVVLANIRQFWKQVRARKWPTLMVSYERGRLKPAELAAEMADFLGMELTDEKLAEIVEFVSPSGGYLMIPPEVVEKNQALLKYLEIVPSAPTVDVPNTVNYGDELVIRWQPDPDAGPQRRADISVTAHGRTWTPKIVQGDDTEIRLNAEENKVIFSTKQITLRVRTRGLGGDSPWSEPHEVKISRLAPNAPTVQVPNRVNYDDELVVCWQPDAKADPQRGAEVSVTAHGRTWTPKKVHGAGTEVILSAERNKAVFAAKKIAIQVRTRGSGGQSPWSQPHEVEIIR